ncbi:MAG: hypothetical protein KBC11_03105 [Candidatus Pacebacteria bacterium]|nr:hypothetical protein [Candidatus Paceibacterota bacterium]
MSEDFPGVTQKVDEYALRILNGEDPDFVLQGADAFRSAVETKVAEYNKRKEKELDIENNEGEVLQENTLTQVISEEKVAERKQKDEELIKKLTSEIKGEGFLSKEEIEKRKKLSGWSASYELAAIAQKQGKDLSKLSREEYADFAIENYLTIDDDQLRVQPWQRNELSVEAIILKSRELRSSVDPDKEKAFASFSHGIMELAKKDQKDRYLKEGVRVLSGTKDSNSWLFFSVNDGVNQNESDTFKSYFSLNDLNNFSPEQFISFMEVLQKRGYNGGVKIFQDLTEQGTRLNDQVVMHGYSEADAELAVEVAKEFFAENIGHTSVGKDQIIEGESKSYSQILAQKIKDSIKNKS